MRKTTRDADLASLEEGVAKAKTSEGKKHRKALLEAVYEQMKDPFLEKMRIELIDAMKRNDMVKFYQIRRKVEDYAKTKEFIKKQIQARKRISKLEADVYLKKEVIKNG